MFRKRLVASVAAAPLLLFAGQALAEITITDTRTSPVLTSTGADTLRVTSTGKIKPTATAGGGSLIINSNNNAVNEGEISTRDIDNTAAVLINGGVTANFTNKGVITVDDSYEATDSDKDGILDGPFAEGTNRYGIRVTGAGTYTGTIFNEVGGVITVTGNNSAGISIESAMTGTLLNRGSIVITGTNTYGIHVLDTAPVTGTINISGNIAAVGENTVGAAIDGDVTGAVAIQGAIVSRGYRFSTRPATAAGRALLQAEDMLQGGGGVRITGNVTGGVLLAAAPTANSDNDGDGWVDSYDTDDDNDGIKDVDDTDANGDGIKDNDYDNDGTANSSDSDDDNDGIADGDDDDDDGNGLVDGDTDGDGIVDTAEGSAAISVQGSAPALFIGSNTENLTIGNVGAGDLAYGLVLRGSVAADGLLDDVSATGVQLGGNAGFTTAFGGGVRIEGNITANSYNAEAQALYIRSGAVVDKLWNQGTIFSTYSATSAPLATEDSFNIRGVRIEAGATVNTVLNTGNITASVQGERSNAIAFQDLSGTVGTFTNTGAVTAYIVANDDGDDTDDSDSDTTNETVVGVAIALDLRLNTTGVHILQYSVTGDRDGDGVLDAADADVDGDGVINADDDDKDNDGIKDANDDEDGLDIDGDGARDSLEAAIYGDIMLGSGADTVDLRNGIIVGDISFGAGADVFNVGFGTWVAGFSGEISDSDGQLTLNLVNGVMQLDNTGVVDATSLTVSADSTLTVTADPVGDTATQIQVATATLADGAQLGLQLTSLITTPSERYTIIKTDTPAGLTVGTIDNSLLGEAPYLIVAEASVNTALGEVYLDVRRRTALEMDLTGNRVLALDAVYDALSSDENVMNAFLGATTREEFLSLYDQMLPDQGEGLFSAVNSLTSTISRLTATKPDPRERYGPDSFWMQEINVEVMRDAGVALGSETKAFGFVAGYESMGADGGALGATLAFISAEEKDDVAAIGEETTISLLEAGVYWRRSVGSWLFSARGSAGYAWFDGDRLFISPTNSLIRQADSGWNGFTGLASLSASYQAEVGRFFVRPLVSLDYLYLSEGSRQETGGEDAFNLFIEDRTSSRLSGTAEVAFGATFGRELWWRPEVRVGYRQYLAGEMGDTVFRFKNGQLVALPPNELGDNAVVLGLSLKAGTPMSYVAIEGEYEATDGEDRYNLQLAGRMMF